MHAYQQLDLYCERLGAGLWVEPLNALSNLAFFIAAYILFRQLKLARVPPLDKGVIRAEQRVLLPLIVLVGIGSLAFHTFATVWAQWLDLLFIELFIYSYLALYLRRVFVFDWRQVVMVVLTYAGAEWASTQAFTPGAFNGSYRYLPALLAVAVMSIAAIHRAPSVFRYLAAATLTFLIAIVFRSADMILCDIWPWGTHFIWHSLNALVLYFCVAALRQTAISTIK